MIVFKYAKVYEEKKSQMYLSTYTKQYSHVYVVKYPQKKMSLINCTEYF